jgi:hypothetical protein
MGGQHMQHVLKLIVFSVIFSTLFLSNCTSPSSSKNKLQEVSFSNVWFSDDVDLVDLDGDGYYSNVRLNVDLDVSNGSLETSLLIGYRIYDPVDTAGYYEYFYSNPFFIEGSTNEDAVYLVLGLDADQLPQAGYDFIIQALSTTDPGAVFAEASATTHQSLVNIPIEETRTDVGLSIYSVLWDLDNLVDLDGDEYFTEAALIVDVDVNSGSTDVYLAIYSRPSGTSSYTLYAVTEDFSIFEDDGDDAVVLESFDDFPHGFYDFKVEAFFNENLFVEDEYELGNMALETLSEDKPLYQWLWHTDQTFEDGLTYTSGDLTESWFAVRFNQPLGSIQCVIKQIAFYVIEADGNAQICAWDDDFGFPGVRFYSPAATNSLNVGWNIFNVDIDVTHTDPFYVGYQQAQFSSPFLGYDNDSPFYNSSYAFNSTTNQWYILDDPSWENLDFGVEVYVQYVIGSEKEGALTKGDWIRPHTFQSNNLKKQYLQKYLSKWSSK